MPSSPIGRRVRTTTRRASERKDAMRLTVSTAAVGRAPRRVRRRRRRAADAGATARPGGHPERPGRHAGVGARQRDNGTARAAAERHQRAAREEPAAQQCAVLARRPRFGAYRGDGQQPAARRARRADPADHHLPRNTHHDGGRGVAPAAQLVDHPVRRHHRRCSSSRRSRSTTGSRGRSADTAATPGASSSASPTWSGSRTGRPRSRSRSSRCRVP